MALEDFEERFEAHEEVMDEMPLDISLNRPEVRALLKILDETS